MGRRGVLRGGGHQRRTPDAEMVTKINEITTDGQANRESERGSPIFRNLFASPAKFSALRPSVAPRGAPDGGGKPLVFRPASQISEFGVANRLSNPDPRRLLQTHKDRKLRTREF